jgi:hypothetical protein
LTALLLLLLTAAPARASDTLVVCPAEFRAALAPWIEYRSAAGHSLEVIGNGFSAGELRGEIRRRAHAGSLRYVVLVGDADARPADSASSRKVPTHQAAAKVTLPYGAEKTIATDNWYADLDDNSVPDVAIGRLPARSPDQLSVIVEKILAYERSADFGSWRRQVNLLAGVGGFGPLADAAIETAAKRIVMAGVPPAFATRITYGSLRSPYCPDPRRFRSAAIESLNEGSLCWVYLGHAWPARLADLKVPGGSYPSLGRTDLDEVRCRHGAPFACLLSCYAGAFAGPEDCLAEAMLASPGAPVAVVGGSGVTMPYAMAVLGTELLDEFFQRATPTIGLALLQAKRRMVAPAEKSNTRQGLDALASLLNPGSLDEELVEHLYLFNLLGDPLLRLRMPVPIAMSCAAKASGDSVLEISGASPVAGRATIELVPRRDLLSFRPPERHSFNALDAGASEFDETYRRANEPCLSRVEWNVQPGAFSIGLPVPTKARGECHVRMFVEGSEAHAAGSADVEIDRAPPVEVGSQAERLRRQ